MKALGWSLAALAVLCYVVAAVWLIGTALDGLAGILAAELTGALR